MKNLNLPFSPAVALNIAGLKDISSELLLPNGKLKLLDHADYAKFTPEEIRLFCHKHGRYGLPTIEAVDFIKTLIAGRSVIEIGSGHGDLGYHLGIPMTDSKIQFQPDVRMLYKLMGQTVIEYPEDVEKLDALEAIKKYKPQVVVASWITQWISPDEPQTSGGSVYGIKEDEMLEKVEQYIMIGNLKIHGDKKILAREHTIFKPLFIRSRASYPEDDAIFLWEGNKNEKP
jgi:hypothetical protein